MGFVGDEKKPINTKHINVFWTALAQQSSQGWSPTRPRDKWDKPAIWLWNYTQRKAGLSPGRAPVCPRDWSRFCPRYGSRLSRTPSRPKCLCLLVFLVWNFQAKSGKWGFCALFLDFPSKSRFKRSLRIQVQVPDILLPDVGDQPK